MDNCRLKDIMEQVWSIESGAIAKLAGTVDMHSIDKIIQAILDCKRINGRIITTGAGTSAMAAKKIAHSLCCVEVPSLFLSPCDAVHGGLGIACKGDVVIAISKGGGTNEIIKLIPSIKEKGLVLIGVTENGTSSLAKASDIVLKIRVEREADSFNMLATSSTMAVIAVFDAIAVALMEYTGYTKEQFAVIHPGGAVGERLTQEKGGNTN